MPIYHLAQVQYVFGQDRAEPPTDLLEAMAYMVNTSDSHLLDFVLSAFNLRLKQDPANLRVSSSPYYCGITNVIEEGGQRTIRNTKALNGLFWELLGSLCSQGWEPFASNSGNTFSSS